MSEQLSTLEYIARFLNRNEAKYDFYLDDIHKNMVTIYDYKLRLNPEILPAGVQKNILKNPHKVLSHFVSFIKEEFGQEFNLSGISVTYHPNEIFGDMILPLIKI